MTTQEKHKTYHLMVLDRSGSMQNVRDVTISGLNEQLQSIRKDEKNHQEQEQVICFVTFSNDVEHEDLWNKKITDIDDFNRDTYVPDAGTALFDGVGISINKLRDQIKDELLDRKANVIVTIFTDGGENSSQYFKEVSQIKSLIEEVKETGLWTVAFLGCGNNVFDVAESMGIDRGSTLAYAAGEDGTQSAFASMSVARSVRTASYSKAISANVDTSEVNQAGKFFDNMDLSGVARPDDEAEEKEEDK